MSLKKELEQHPGVKVKLRMGGLGVLDVKVDGKTVFSHQQTGRIPTADEILRLAGTSAG